MSRWTKCAFAAAVAATVLAGGCFVWTCYLSTLPAPTPVSLSLAFRPWTRNIAPSLVIWAISFAVLGVALRLRPSRGETTRKGSSLTLRVALLLGTLALTAFTVHVLPRPPVRPIPPSGDLVLAAARAYVAWIVEDRALCGEIRGYDWRHESRGFAHEGGTDWVQQTLRRVRYANAPYMRRRMRRFYVVCDTLPVDTKLSNDRRVSLVPSTEVEEIFEREGFRGNAYLRIAVLSSSRRAVVLDASIMYHRLGGEGFEIRFEGAPDGSLRVEGRLVWVS